jgi:hypothetical protein
MKPLSISPVAKALFVGWSMTYLSYTILAVWATTGPYALAGPSTVTDNILSGVWLTLSVMQVAVAFALHTHFKPWVFWTAATLATLSIGMVFLPVLALLVT